MRKLILSVILILCCFSASATDFCFGICTSYIPEDSRLFNPVDFSSSQNYRLGITADISKGKFAFTEDILCSGLSGDNPKIEFFNSFSIRNRISERFCLDCSLVFQTALERAVEGSDKLYLTSNGVNIVNIPKLKGTHLLDILGMLNLRFASSFEISDNLIFRSAYSWNAFPFEDALIKNPGFENIVGLGSLSLAVLYRLHRYI